MEQALEFVSFWPNVGRMTVVSKPIRITVLRGHPEGHRGVLTPDCCQICKHGGPGMVIVIGLNGHLFSAHRWPCAEREGLRVFSSEDDLR